jgi:hypothetical protein
MGTVRGWDAAFCPDPLPDPGFAFAGCYIGGSSAFRVWPDSELARVAHMPVLPIWVPTPFLDNPRQTAIQAARRMEQVGVPHHARPFRAMMLDLETVIAPAWVRAFADRFASLGYDTIVYGSISDLFLNPRRTGYAVADPTGHPHMFLHPGVIITQYQFDVQLAGGVVDLDLAEDWLMAHLGPLAGKLAAPAAFPAAGVLAPRELADLAAADAGLPAVVTTGDPAAGLAAGVASLPELANLTDPSGAPGSLPGDPPDLGKPT